MQTSASLKPPPDLEPRDRDWEGGRRLASEAFWVVVQTQWSWPRLHKSEVTCKIRRRGIKAVYMVQAPRTSWRQLSDPDRRYRVHLDSATNYQGARSRSQQPDTGSQRLISAALEVALVAILEPQESQTPPLEDSQSSCRAVWYANPARWTFPLLLSSKARIHPRRAEDTAHPHQHLHFRLRTQ